jgi:branched-chain amino acid transport system permease protein
MERSATASTDSDKIEARHRKLQSYSRDIFGLACLALAICVIGLTVANTYYLSMFIYSSIYAIAALGICLLFGFAGQISLGQAAFFGIGAYTSAWVVMRLDLPPLLGTVAAMLFAGAFGWIVSRPLLRLTTNYLAMGTLAFGMICFTAFAQLNSITGGIDPGIVGMPAFHVGALILDKPRSMYWLVTGVMCLVLFLIINLVHSRVGRALRALKVSEVAAAGLGIDVVGYKVMTFTVAAALTGLAGSLFAHFQRSYTASGFGVGLSIELLIMVIVGSVATPWGALFGALFVTLMPSLLEDFEQYKLLVYGLIMTAVMIYMPDGLGKAVIDAASSKFNRRRVR